MGIDIRLPVGILFLLLGLILSIYGLASNPARYQQSLGIDINLYWGIVLFVFGLVMFLLGRRGARREATRNASPGSEIHQALPHSSHPPHH